MNPEEKARIARFLNDEPTVQSVRSILEETFLKPRGNDVHYLAAAKLAFDYLREGFKEMEKCRTREDDSTGRTQPGL